MTSSINYGTRVQDREVRLALQQAADEISAISGHVAAFQSSINVAATDATAVGTVVNALLAKLVVAGLMAAS